jgi:hypothetical protein
MPEGTRYGRRRPVQRAAAAILLIAALAALLTAYKPSVSPLGLHPRGVSLAAASGQLLVDTSDSELTDNGLASLYYSRFAGQLALNYAFYLQNYESTQALATAVGLHGQSVAASGPFTLLLNRGNVTPKSPAPVDPSQVNHAYRLLTDVDGVDPILSIYAQAPTARDAILMVDKARALIVQHVAAQERGDPPDASDPGDAGIAVLRPLGPVLGGTVTPNLRWELMAFVFGLVNVLGGSLLYARRRGLARKRGAERAISELDRLDDEPTRGDDWPNTSRILPWALAGFVAMLFLVPFDAISLPVSLPLDSSLDRPLLVALALLWVSSMLVLSGAARPRVKFTRVHLMAFAFFGVCCVGAAFNAGALIDMGEVSLVVKKLALLISYILFFVIVASVVRPREVPRFAALMVGLGVIVALATVVEYRTHYNVFYSLWGSVFSVSRPSDLDVPDSIGRLTVYGPTGNPLELAALLSMMIPFAVMGSIDAATRRRRLLYSLAIGLLIAGGLATSRKTSLVAPVGAILVLVAYRPRVVLRSLLGLTLALGVVVHFTSPGALGSVVSQLEPGHFNSVLTTTDRTARYDAVRPDVLNHLLLGRGYQSYDPHKYRILDNQYLDLLITVGLVGTLLFIGMLGAMISSAHRVIRGPDPRRASLALASASSIAVIAITCGLFDVLSFPHVPYLLFFIAALIATLREPSPAPEPARLAPARPAPLGRAGMGLGRPGTDWSEPLFDPVPVRSTERERVPVG